MLLKSDQIILKDEATHILWSKIHSTFTSVEFHMLNIRFHDYAMYVSTGNLLILPFFYFSNVLDLIICCIYMVFLPLLSN